MKFAVCDDEQEMADLVAEKLREFYLDECEITCYVDEKILLEDSARVLFDAFFLDIGRNCASVKPKQSCRNQEKTAGFFEKYWHRFF